MRQSFAAPTFVVALMLAFAGVNNTLASTSDVLISLCPHVLAQTATPESGASDATSGTWLMTWTTKEKEIRHATLQLQQDHGAVSGTAKLEGGPIKGSFPVTGRVQGNQISLKVKVFGRGVSFTGTVEKNKMSGTTKEGAPWLASHQ